MGVFLGAGFCAGRLELSDEELITEVLPDLDLVVPGIADMIEFVEITRWTPVRLLSEVGMHRLIAKFDAAIDDNRRIQHAGDYLSVASIEGSVVGGERAAGRLHATLGRAG